MLQTLLGSSGFVAVDVCSCYEYLRETDLRRKDYLAHGFRGFSLLIDRLCLKDGGKAKHGEGGGCGRAVPLFLCWPGKNVGMRGKEKRRDGRGTQASRHTHNNILPPTKPLLILATSQ